LQLAKNSRFDVILCDWQMPGFDGMDVVEELDRSSPESTVGVGKATSPWFSVFVLGIRAGSYIGFGRRLATSVTFDLAAKAGGGIQKLVAGSAFSLGLMLVVIAGAELFTGNNLMISSVMSKEITFRVMLQRWGLVFLANFTGSICWRCCFIFAVELGRLSVEQPAAGHNRQRHRRRRVRRHELLGR
jgi:formate/nitrite transporter FocA (FNT family)